MTDNICYVLTQSYRLYTTTKFIKKSQMNLTVTVDYLKSGAKNLIYANFDPINTWILGQDMAIPQILARIFVNCQLVFPDKKWKILKLMSGQYLQ